MNVGAVFHELPHEHKPTNRVKIAESAPAKIWHVMTQLHWEHKKKDAGQEDPEVVEF